MALPTFFNPKTTVVHLEAEVADTRVPSFVIQYHAATGISLVPGKDFHVISSANDGKRGLEGRAYFNATPAQVTTLKGHGYRVQGPRTRGYHSDSFSYRIDLNALFWDLVTAGYRI